MASSTSSVVASRRSAISGIVGDRPSWWVSSETTVPRRRCSSCRRRGTRTAQLLSRKCRLSSPAMVGTANVLNSSPRSGSKRSTALIRASDATWIRSSSGSPRLSNRRARYSASPRWVSTSRSRNAGSPVRRYLSKRSWSSSRSDTGPVSGRFTGRPSSGATAAAPDQADGDRIVILLDAVLVDEGRQELLGELGELDRPWSRRALPDDHQLSVVDGEAEGDPARPSFGAHEQVTQLVDGDPEILDVVVAEAQAAGHPGGRQPGQADVLGQGRDR